MIDLTQSALDKAQGTMEERGKAFWEKDKSDRGIKSDGGSTKYYELPEEAKELNDLIEHKQMSFALGNIFKACYRYGEKDSADKIYDLNKIIFFANRLKALEQKNDN